MNCSVIGNWKLYLFICNLAFFEQEIQELLYFCIKYVDNLTVYFERHENITIIPAGSENEHYYFALYHPVLRSNYSIERSPLPKEDILIALLLYKAYYIDHNMELISVKKFVALIRMDMPDLKSMCNIC